MATESADTLAKSLENVQQQAILAKDDLRFVMLQAGFGVGPEAAKSGAAAGAARNPLHGIGSGLLMGGMNGLMAFFGLQGLASSAQNMGAIEQIMRVNNQTPSEANQTLAMLSTGGLSGTSASSWLAGFAKSLQTTMQPDPNTGKLSKQAIMLESLGITPQEMTQSPWMMLNSVAHQYQSLVHKGLGNRAEQLLGLTGTQQFGPAFANWQALQKQASQYQFTSSTKQVQQGALGGQKLSMGLQELKTAFGQLAGVVSPSLAHTLSSIAQSIQGVIKDFQSAQGPMQLVGDVFKTLKKNLGDVGTAAVGLGGVMVALKGYQVAAAAATTIYNYAAKTVAFTQKVAAAATWVFNAALDNIPFVRLALIIAAVITGIVLLITHWKWVTRELGQLAGDFTRFAGHAVSVITHWASTTMGDVTQWAERFIGGIGHWAASTGKSLSHWVSVTAKHLGNWTEKTANSLGKWVETTVKDFADWSKHTLDVVGKALMNFVADITEWAKNLWGDVSQHFADWSAHLGQWAENLWISAQSAFANFTQHIVQWAQDLWNAVANFFKNIGGPIAKFFGNLFNGAGTVASNAGGALGLGGNAPVSSAVTSYGGQIQSIIAGLAKPSAGLTPQLVEAVMQQESGGNASAANYNTNGTMDAGLMQINSTNWGRYGLASNPYNVTGNLTAGIQMLNSLLQQFGGSLQKAIAGYNEGPGNVMAGRPDTSYVQGDMGYMSTLLGNIPHMATGGIVSQPTLALVGEAGPEAVVPLNGGRRGAQGMRDINISITVQANDADHRQMARQVSNELVQNLKRTLNVEWGP